MDTNNIVETRKSKLDKIKKTKSKSDTKFRLFSELDFILNNELGLSCDNIFISGHKKPERNPEKKPVKSKNKDKNKRSHKHVDTKNNVPNNIDGDNLYVDSNYLEKKYVKNDLLINKKKQILSNNYVNIDNHNDNNNNENNNSVSLKKSNNGVKNISNIEKKIRTINPIIQNEVIWYSDELDSYELELKYKNKFNKNNIVLNEQKQIVHTNNETELINILENQMQNDLDSDELELKYKNKFNKNNIVLNEQKQANYPKIYPNDDIEVINMSENQIQNEFDIEYNNDNTNNHTDDNYNEQSNNEYITISAVDTNECDNKNIVINTVDTNKNNKKLEISSCAEQVENFFTSNPELTIVRKNYKRIIDCKKCILKSKKVESNIFELDLSGEPNCSTFKIFNNHFGSSHIYSMSFISDNKTLNPEIVEIYLNDILIKKVYSDIINNLPGTDQEKKNEYNVVDSTYLLGPDTKITVKIFDPNQIDNVYFDIMLEKIDCQITWSAYLEEKKQFEYVLTTHELLYEGVESDITINLEYGYYQDIYVVCDNVLETIHSISLTNMDVVLFEDIPPVLLDCGKNIIVYSLKTGGNIISGIKIDSNNYVNIRLNKYEPDLKVRIYGNKFLTIKKGNVYTLKSYGSYE